MSWRRAATLATVALLLPLTGCGQDPYDAYCSDLGSHRKQIAAMLDSTEPDALFTELGALRAVAKKAPEDIQDDWKTFLDAVDGLQTALKQAGLKPSDYVDGKPPAGLSAADRQAIVAAADDLSGDDVVAAASGIEQEARDVCKINLGL